MPLKYQNEIDAFKFDFECPNDVSPIENEVDVFRFCLTPINHSWNFLSNVVYDRLNGGSFPYNKPGNEHAKCSRCGSSFHYDIELAMRAWKSMPLKRKENLKYTHIAKGKMIPGDGFVTKADNYSHFGFYEASNENENYLKTKFEILNTLS